MNQSQNKKQNNNQKLENQKEFSNKKKGKFHIYAVKTIDEGIEILTGVPAGKKDKNGKFPLGTINYLAQEKLRKFAKIAEGNTSK